MIVAGDVRPHGRQADGTLHAHEVSKSFGGVHALKGVSIELRAGTTTALVGPNGAGKSTLIGILSGRTRSDTGRIESGGRTLSFGSPRDAARFGVQLIPQELVAAPGLSIAENLLMGRYPRTAGFFDRAKLDTAAAAIVGEAGLDVDVRASVDTLSPAELRLMMIAKATSRNCRFLIMDEPTAALSPREVDRIAAAILRLQDRNVGILYVSHRLNEITAFCQQMVVLRDGRLTHTGSMDGIEVRHLIALMSDAEAPPTASTGLAACVPALRPVSAVPLVRGSGLCRGRVADIDVRLHAGEIVGVAGLVGSGRTELLRMLVGVDRAERGELYWHEELVSRPSMPAAIARGISFLPEDRRTQGGFQDLSVGENVGIASAARFSWGRVIRRMRAETRAVAAVVGSVDGVVSRLRHPMRVLSGGNQQKVLIAKWILTGPRVFVFDEPTAGIDVHAKESIRLQLRTLAAQGAGVIVASSDNAELPGLCDRVLVLREGRLVGELLGPQITQANLLALSYGQSAAD